MYLLLKILSVDVHRTWGVLIIVYVFLKPLHDLRPSVNVFFEKRVEVDGVETLNLVF